MPTYLHLHFEAPLQSWGGVAVDPRRPSDSFPRASALAGLLANALGWRHRDARRTTDLQDALDYAVREDRPPARIWDFQTADLSQLSGWTRWGPESPGGGSSDATHILRKEYLADALFTVSLGLVGTAPVSVEEVERRLLQPARPLFLGRKSCIPSAPVCRGRVEAESAVSALELIPLPEGAQPTEAGSRIWADASSFDGSAANIREVWDRRNYGTGRFDRARRIGEGRMEMSREEDGHE